MTKLHTSTSTEIMTDRAQNGRPKRPGPCFRCISGIVWSSKVAVWQGRIPTGCYRTRARVAPAGRSIPCRENNTITISSAEMATGELGECVKWGEGAGGCTAQSIRLGLARILRLAHLANAMREIPRCRRTVVSYSRAASFLQLPHKYPFLPHISGIPAGCVRVSRTQENRS